MDQDNSPSYPSPSPLVLKRPPALSKKLVPKRLKYDDKIQKEIEQMNLRYAKICDTSSLFTVEEQASKANSYLRMKRCFDMSQSCKMFDENSLFNSQKVISTDFIQLVKLHEWTIEEGTEESIILLCSVAKDKELSFGLYNLVKNLPFESFKSIMENWGYRENYNWEIYEDQSIDIKHNLVYILKLLNDSVNQYDLESLKATLCYLLRISFDPISSGLMHYITSPLISSIVILKERFGLDVDDLSDLLEARSTPLRQALDFLSFLGLGPNMSQLSIAFVLKSLCSDVKCEMRSEPTLETLHRILLCAFNSVEKYDAENICCIFHLSSFILLRLDIKSEPSELKKMIPLLSKFKSRFDTRQVDQVPIIESIEHFHTICLQKIDPFFTKSMILLYNI